MNIPHALTDNTLTLYIDGEAHVIPRDWREFDALARLLQGGDEQAVIALVDRYTPEGFKASNFTSGEEVSLDDITMDRRHVYYKGQEVRSSLARRMLDVQEAGLPLDAWLLFMAKVYENPAEFAREELYDWVEGSGLPLTSDGCFFAYKRVKDNGEDWASYGSPGRYVDIHTGTMANDVGTVVEMDRRDVDSNRAHHCSTGLHFCSEGYLPSFGSHGNGQATLVVKVDPADVVSIPSDYRFTKGRTWRYEVVQAVPDEVVPQDIEWDDVVIEWPADENGDPVTFAGNRASSTKKSPWQRVKGWWTS